MRRIALLLPLLVACGSSANEGTEATAAAPFVEEGAAGPWVDLQDYANRYPGGADLYDAMVTSLRRGFDAICGDTFCEGDYSNIESLRFRCSVSSRDGRLGRCVWVLAGSQEHVVPETGAIEVDGRIFECAIPVVGTAGDLLETLGGAGRNALDTPLPGTDASVYDALVACL